MEQGDEKERADVPFFIKNHIPLTITDCLFLAFFLSVYEYNMYFLIPGLKIKFITSFFLIFCYVIQYLNFLLLSHQNNRFLQKLFSIQSIYSSISIGRLLGHSK